MARLFVDRVTFSWVTGEPLFSDLCFTLEPGWTGITGANGSGKSTLLSMLSGDIVPDAGRVVRTPSSLKATRCDQVSGFPDDAMRGFAHDESPDAGRLRSLLRLSVDDFSRWESLSPGEQKRWQIGAALYLNPPLLLLDEPTNHLDADAKQWLIEALFVYEGIGVIVSHDSELLDALTTQTLWHDHDDKWLVVNGGFSVAQSHYEALRDRRREHIADLDRQLKRERARLRASEDRVRRTESFRSVSRRRKNAGDNEAGSMKAGIRIDQAIASAGRSSQVQKRRVDRLAEKRDSQVVVSDYRGRLNFSWEPPRLRTLLNFQRASLCAGERVLARDVALRIERDSRVRIQGANGAGKTTLLQEVVNEWRHGEDHITWIPQELSPAECNRVRQAIAQRTPQQRGDFLAIYARLGADPKKWLRDDRLSPGEARKMLIADGLARQSWLLVLDEPTNHLDPRSVQALREALEQWPGALVIVTHDDHFAKALVRQTFVLEGEQWKVLTVESPEW